jgi:hypothetical protein
MRTEDFSHPQPACPLGVSESSQPPLRHTYATFAIAAGVSLLRAREVHGDER